MWPGYFEYPNPNGSNGSWTPFSASSEYRIALPNKTDLAGPVTILTYFIGRMSLDLNYLCKAYCFCLFSFSCREQCAIRIR